MKKSERFAFLACPMIFGLVLIFIGMYAIKQKPELPHGIIMICSGLICMCFYTVNSLLAKIINKLKKAVKIVKKR